MRRVLRIFPLYYGVLALVFFVAPLISVLRGPTLDYLLDHQAWAWLYAVNIYIAIQGDWSFSYLEHLWSLCIEEHFYLVWPFAVFMMARRPRDADRRVPRGLARRHAGAVNRIVDGPELVDHLCADRISEHQVK